jgi:hypothetical protein
MGWATLSNTNLVNAAERAGFEIFITCDQNIAFQQTSQPGALRSSS